MFMNEGEIEHAASMHHACPNVRKGVKLLKALMEAVNRQSDGWHSWPVPSRAADKLQELLKTAGNLSFGNSTTGTIKASDLKKAIAPIRAMVTRAKSGAYGGKFEFDVDAALGEEPKLETVDCTPVGFQGPDAKKNSERAEKAAKDMQETATNFFLKFEELAGVIGESAFQRGLKAFIKESGEMTAEDAQEYIEELNAIRAKRAAACEELMRAVSGKPPREPEPAGFKG